MSTLSTSGPELHDSIVEANDPANEGNYFYCDSYYSYQLHGSDQWFHICDAFAATFAEVFNKANEGNNWNHKLDQVSEIWKWTAIKDPSIDWKSVEPYSVRLEFTPSLYWNCEHGLAEAD